MDQEIKKTASEAAGETAEVEKPKKQENKPKSGGKQTSSQTSPKKKKKKKYKLQAMDIVTIIFTAIIVGIMAYVLYNQFAGDNNDDGGSASMPTATNSAAAPTATAKPVLSDIGNIYGNITNDANIVVIDKREYFISTDANGAKHIFVTADENTKDIIQTDASSLNVVTDYISDTDQSNGNAYYVFYINGDGKICYVHDTSSSESGLQEQIFLDGKYQTIDVSGEYVYYLDINGQIGKANIDSKETTILSSERAYKNFVLYYGVIYALGKADNFIYSMPSNPSSDSSSTAAPTSSSSPAPTSGTEEDASKENVLISEACRNFVVDSDWIYVLNDGGIARYLVDGSGKDTLSALQADALNVYKGEIFYSYNDELYTASAETLLLGNATKISATFGKNNINISGTAVYLQNEAGKLLKSAYDSKNSTYGEFKEMN
jgi:hypothetical protein